MYAPMEAAARAVWALAHVYYRPKATPGRPLDHGLTGFHRRGRHGGTVNIVNKKNFFFRPPGSVPLVSLDQYRTE